MNKVRWTVQVLLAAAFTVAGGMKVVTPAADLAANMNWVNAVPSWMPMFAGVVEVLGAIGLVVPALTRIKPGLTPLAAAGLFLTMLAAAGLHISLGETDQLTGPMILGALSAFVAWGRYSKVPITPKDQ